MKKAVSLFLAAVMLISVFTVGASAFTPELSLAEEYRVAEQIQFDPRTEVPLPEQGTLGNTADQNHFFAADADAPYLFYNYLNTDQKAIYDAIKEAPFQTSYSNIPLSTYIECDATLSGGTLSLPNSAWVEIYEIILGGVSAFQDDYPQYFWCNVSKLGIGDHTNSQNSNGTYHVVIKKLGFTIQVPSAYTDIVGAINAYNDMTAVIDTFKVKGNTRYEKVKYIHDWIVTRVQYDENYNNANANPTAHEPVSVFTAPFKPVCEGYAEAFKILCDREKIPCVVVVGDAGGGHAWNYVKMEDGKWYAVDSTWDDPIGNAADNIHYDYFLVGADSKPTFGNTSSTFSQIHINTGARYSNTSFALTYPTLNTDSYSKMILRQKADTAVSKSNMMVFIGKNAVLSNQFTASGTYSVSTSGNTTGGTVTVKSSGTVVEQYTVVRRGDVNKDNAVNASDYARVKSIVTCEEPAFTDRAQKAAADMNGDGVIDAFDALALDIYRRS